MADQLVQKVILRMKDEAGKTGTISYQITTDAGSDPTGTATGLISALASCSNAVVVHLTGQTADNEDVGSVSSGAFNIRDKLRVEYVGTQNDHHFLDVGDPQDGIWSTTNPDQVDPTNTDWMELKSALESNAKDKTGNAVTVIRGFRHRSNRLKNSLKFT